MTVLHKFFLPILMLFVVGIFVALEHNVAEKTTLIG